MVDVGHVQRIRDVRYHRNDVDGCHIFYLWSEECLDTLAMAGMESNYSDDVPGGLDAEV